MGGDIWFGMAGNDIWATNDRDDFSYLNDDPCEMQWMQWKDIGVL